MNAYNELYIDDSSEILGEYLDCMVNRGGYSADDALTFFSRSAIGYEFESGNPKYIAGCSGTELAMAVILEVFGKCVEFGYEYCIDKSPEYWCGWILARYQWIKNISFKKLYERGLTAKHIINRYILHEADETRAFDEFDEYLEYRRKQEESMLKRLRTYYEMTQKQLSEKSGVSLRMIQLYEQGQSDITHAQINIVKALADALGCRPDELVS
ncbi:MAG: helix-turn-helix transcriptional regulator [Lachnospiraceae bacterium]|nr:helix-turn-helix transcriptional regulator [Lachnospiraceae bacterium]